MGAHESKISNDISNNYVDHQVKTVVIASPHAKCEHEIKDHYCDSVSHKCAQYLYKSLTNKNWSTSYVRGDINRKFIDLNRLDSRDKTAFRKNITKIYERNKSNDLWVIDIHSYPGGKYSSESSECVLLLPHGNTLALTYNQRLMKYLKQKNISVLMYHGSQDNDITTEATYNYNFNHVFIIEMSEILSEVRLNFIISSISEWMDSLI